MKEHKYLEMPWSIEDTIENLTFLKENFAKILLKINFEGLGESDAKELEFDFDRAIKAIKKVQEYEVIGTAEEFKALKDKEKRCKKCKYIIQCTTTAELYGVPKHYSGCKYFEEKENGNNKRRIYKRNN